MMAEISRAQALIFDCDGTLVDSMPAHHAAWGQVLADYGIAFEQRRCAELAGVGTVETLQILCREQGVTLDIERVVQAKCEAFARFIPAIRPIEPVVRLVRQYYGQKPLAVATSNFRNHTQAMLEQLAIWHCFDTLVAAEDVARHKPDPEPYREAARRLGIEPRYCCAFEDTDVGIAAAQGAGMAVIDVRAWRAALGGDAIGLGQIARR